MKVARPITQITTSDVSKRCFIGAIPFLDTFLLFPADLPPAIFLLHRRPSSITRGTCVSPIVSMKLWNGKLFFFPPCLSKIKLWLLMNRNYRGIRNWFVKYNSFFKILYLEFNYIHIWVFNNDYSVKTG